jgi:RNA polymerase sigma factor (sigma-70 family)
VSAPGAKPGRAVWHIEEMRRDITETLARNHGRFLRFVRARVANDAVAEDVLHAGYVKATEKAGDLRASDSLVPWFRRILVTELADHFRRAAREQRAVAALERELEVAPTPEPPANTCRCVNGALTGLKREYAAAVTAVDLDGVAVEQLASAQGITANNASVRLHLARASLRSKLRAVCGSCAGQGCFDCTCSPPATPA